MTKSTRIEGIHSSIKYGVKLRNIPIAILTEGGQSDNYLRRGTMMRSMQQLEMDEDSDSSSGCHPVDAAIGQS